ncbi:SDR family oxidoreductase [Lactiplantibacillus herbarum]|uniref:SDR family oxidoreductase n=1 Tax=Lactiplantibacillus herbarum TaxID=1670446 RepID=UPI00064E321F|nr:SDR family oxidoreductase [Lactiplantibacillus herbarum]
MDDDVILVTGAAKGIGLATVKQLAPHVSQVVLNVHHAIEADEWTALTAEFSNVTQLVGDVSDESIAAELVATVIDQFGRLDGLVNNAGITKDQLLTRMSTTDFTTVLQTNLVGTFNMTKFALKIMQKQRRGAIVNVASVVGLHGNLGQANYAASKAGIIGLTKTTALEGARRQIRCNAIAPGMITTDMTAQLNERVTDAALASIPLQRFGTPAEVAQAIEFLLYQPYLTGQVLTVDGGMTI